VVPTEEEEKEKEEPPLPIPWKNVNQPYVYLLLDKETSLDELAARRNRQQKYYELPNCISW
jgi:hypothetical protein